MKNKQHWSTLKERGSLFGINTLVLLYKILGKRFFKICFVPVMFYFYLTGGVARSAAIDYWIQIEITRNSDRSNWLQRHWNAFKIFLSFGLGIVDKFDAWLGRIGIDDIQVMDEACLESLNEQKGSIILSSHLGNMEICRAIFGAGEHKKKLNVITYNEHAPSFNKFLVSINPEAAINFVHINNFGLADTIMLKQKIDDGEAIVIFADRTSVDNPESVEFVPFLSKPAPIAIGPFALASIMECPIYFMTCLKDSASGRYQAHVELFAEPKKIKRAERKIYFKQLMEKYTGRLTYYCLKEPYQWYNFFDFWQANESDNQQKPEKEQNKIGVS